MPDDIASTLTDHERKVLGIISEKDQRLHRIRGEVQTGRTRNEKARVRRASILDIEKIRSPEDSRRAIEQEVSRVNKVIANNTPVVATKIHGPLPGPQMPGFHLLAQYPFWTPGFGIGTELHAPSTWIFGTTIGEDSRTLVYGVKNRFVCPYSTGWADKSRPTQKFSIYPRIYISGWVYAVAEDDLSFVTANEGDFFLSIKVDLFQISPVGDPIVPIGGAPLEEWKVLHVHNNSDTQFLDYEYGYLPYTPMFQLHVARANVFCDIETTLKIECHCGIGPVTARCGLLDKSSDTPFADERGRVEIWPQDFGIYPTDYN